LRFRSRDRFFSFFLDFDLLFEAALLESLALLALLLLLLLSLLASLFFASAASEDGETLSVDALRLGDFSAATAFTTSSAPVTTGSTAGAGGAAAGAAPGQG
jgi:hypothetical protein